jgi:hypothetical protein
MQWGYVGVMHVMSLTATVAQDKNTDQHIECWAVACVVFEPAPPAADMRQYLHSQQHICKAHGCVRTAVNLIPESLQVRAPLPLALPASCQRLWTQ